MKNNKLPTLLIIGGAIFLFLILCTVCCIVIFYFSSKEETSNNKYSNIDFIDYLGYEEIDIQITDNEEFSYEIASFSDDIADLVKYEEDLKNAAISKNPESFFTAYSSYNQAASKAISRSYAFSDYNGEEIGDFFPFILNVSAKERFSYWYYVPIFGSMLKAKHQTIETSREGIYNYMKNELADVDRKDFLNEYGLKSIEDIKNATDSQVEVLARDPELRAGIDWTKVSTQLAEHAAQAVTDSYKIGPSRSPDVSTLVNGTIRIFSKPGDSISETFDPTNKPRSTILLSKSVIDDIDEKLGDDVGKKLDDIDKTKLNKLTDSIIDKSKKEDILIINTSTENDAGKLYLTTGDWNLLTTIPGTPPVFTEIVVDKDFTSDIYVPVEDIDTFRLDPEIAVNLGFDIDIETSEIEVTSCMDVNGYSVDSYAENNCQKAFNQCQSSPYQIKDEYSKCIGSGGGCWDIGRWEYINDGNCPIDKDNNLDYSDKRLQPDYEYFGDGNRRYCECVVDCRIAYWEKKDCTAVLRSCCEAVE